MFNSSSEQLLPPNGAPEEEKSAVVRLNKPKIILLGFHGTISPLDWEDRAILPYLREHLLDYIKQNYHKDQVFEAIEVLRDRSFYDHFIIGLTQAPLIVPFEFNLQNRDRVFKTVYEYIIWQMTQSKGSEAAMLVCRLCWEQGYRDRQIKTILYEDVMPAVLKWKAMDIKLGLFSHLDEETCRLMLASTTAGDLASQVDYYFDITKPGSRREAESYRTIATTLNVPTSEMMFLCDYGQDVKAASEAGLQVALFNRPGGRKNRTYYKIRFPNAYNMEKIQLL